jgi:hypothetical protein
MLISATRSAVLYNILSQWLVLILQTSCSLTGPYTFLNILLSHFVLNTSKTLSYMIDHNGHSFKTLHTTYFHFYRQILIEWILDMTDLVIIKYTSYIICQGVGIAQSLQRRATGWTTRVRFPAVQDFFFSTASRPTLGPTQPPIQLVPGALSLGVKRQGPEADHSPPSSAEVKNYGGIPPLPHMSSWRGA